MDKFQNFNLFLINCCKKDIKFYTLFEWYYKSWSNELRYNNKFKLLIDKSDSFLFKLKNELIKNESLKNNISLLIDNNINNANILFKNLTSYSLYLKQHLESKRKNMTKIFLKKLNQLLIKRRINYDKVIKPSFYREGILIPFSIFDGYDKSELLVGIIDNKVKCFNTKCRVPYMIILETIKYEDLTNYKPIINNKYLFEEEIAIVLEDSLLTFNFKDLNQENLNSQKKEKKWIKFQTKEFKLKTTNNLKFSKVETHKDKKPINKKFWKFAENKIKIESNRNIENHSLKTKLKGIFSKFLNSEKKKNINEIQSFKDSQSKSRKSFNLNSSNEKKRISEYKKKSFTKLNKVKYRFKSVNKLNLNNLIEIKKIIKFYKEISLKLKNKAINKRLILQIDRLNQKKILVKNDKLKDFRNWLSKRINTIKTKEVFGDLWENERLKIKNKSIYSKFPSYKLRRYVIKGGDDLRKDIIVMQLKKKFKEVFDIENTNLYLFPYEIIVTSHDSGFLEFIDDSIPIDDLKKKYKNKNLKEIYEIIFCDDNIKYVKNFAESLAGYSLFCYFLQIKDRHNGNILINKDGNLIHIDYGFVFSLSPGKINFENAPFKLTKDYINLLGGFNGDFYHYFRNLWIRGLNAWRKHYKSILSIIEIMSFNSKLDCFENFSWQEFKSKFKIDLCEEEIIKYIDKILTESKNSTRTVWYDEFQKLTNNIEP